MPLSLRLREDTLGSLPGFDAWWREQCEQDAAPRLALSGAEQPAFEYFAPPQLALSRAPPAVPERALPTQTLPARMPRRSGLT